MKEIWKDIKGFEGKYQVSNLGNVLSLNYGNRGYSRLLVPKCNNKGRLWVELRGGPRKYVLVHTLVAEAFIPNPNGYTQINHKDENPKNNDVRNLEWCTQAYNNKYSRDRHPEYSIENIRKAPYPVGEEWYRIHACCDKKRIYESKYKHTPEVIQRDRNGCIVRRWDSLYTAYRGVNGSPTSIKECCEGKRRTAYGYKWQYAV